MSLYGSLSSLMHCLACCSMVVDDNIGNVLCQHIQLTRHMGNVVQHICNGLE